MADRFMKEIGCLATRYVGCNRQVPIKIGAAMSFYDGTKTIVGRVAHYRTTEEGLQVTYERQWTKDDLLATNCEKTRRLGGMLRHDQILHSSEEETVSAEFITRAVSIVPRHLYSPGHMEGGKYELVGVIEPARDITAQHKLYLIDEGTAEEQAASTAKEVKMGYYVVDYEDHVQVWYCPISCAVVCVCGPKCALALNNSLQGSLSLPSLHLPCPFSLSPYLPISLSSSFSLQTLWRGISNYFAAKNERTEEGDRLPNWVHVHGVHLASLFAWIFDNNLTSLLAHGRLKILVSATLPPTLVLSLPTSLPALQPLFFDTWHTPVHKAHRAAAPVPALPVEISVTTLPLQLCVRLCVCAR